jgi:hypothetical protein
MYVCEKCNYEQLLCLNCFKQIKEPYNYCYECYTKWKPEIYTHECFENGCEVRVRACYLYCYLHK